VFVAVARAYIHDLNFATPKFVGFSPFTGVLAGRVTDSQVSNVSVTGGSMFTNNISKVGGLMGACAWSQGDESRPALAVRSSDWVGGLIGETFECAINRSFTL